MNPKTISDTAFVLSRVNYGEKDRILNILCLQHGKLSVIAKGVRAGRSKLAGGIELFAENELVLLKSRSDLYIVTSSRMKNYFGSIAEDIEASSYAYECLKMINKLVPVGSGEEYYPSLLSLMKALSVGKIPLVQIKIWFSLKTLDNLGSLPNFNTDSKSKPLSAESEFNYDYEKHCFIKHPDGAYKAEHIKILRHLAKAARPVEIKSDSVKPIGDIEQLVTLILKSHLS